MSNPFNENEKRQRREDVRDILWAIAIAAVLAFVSVARHW